MRSLLSNDLYERICQTLEDFEEFENHERLHGFILKGELIFYEKWFLDHPYEKEDLIRNTTKYLARQFVTVAGQSAKRPALLVLFSMLQSTLVEGDMISAQLDELARGLERELNQHMAARNELAYAHQPHNSLPPSAESLVKATSLSSPALALLRTNMRLAPEDRDAVLGFVVAVIDPLPEITCKGLLLDCELPQEEVERIKFGTGTRNTAEEMLALVERTDNLHTGTTFLERFLRRLLTKNELEGTDIGGAIEALLAHYKQKLASQRSGQAGWRRDLPPDTYVIHREYQNSLAASATDHIVKPYRIDSSAIIRCNLDQQRIDFIRGFNGLYAGFFNFIITSVEYSILNDYIIGSLILELHKRTGRQTDIRPISLYIEDRDALDIEQGNFNLPARIATYFNTPSFRDLLEDSQGKDLVLILWDNLPSSETFRQIALRFSDSFKQYIDHATQKRCLVLLWASYGPVSAEILPDGPVVLPHFEKFDVEHVIQWLDTEFPNVQRNYQLSSQETEYCRRRLEAKLRIHGGRLPGTYTCLREPLELGGII